jgi:arylsulfatase A-like enzyme
MPKQALSRQDFLKLVSFVPAAWFAHQFGKLLGQTTIADRPNVIILVFDAWSADNVQFYRYPRQTMPNLERFCENAIVYHNHFSSGTFTTPGTASLLTGLYPWTHRALNLSGDIVPDHVKHNMFTSLRASHSTLGYAQNEFADLLLYQVGNDIETHLPIGSFNLQTYSIYSASLFKNDARIAFVSLDDNMLRKGEGYDGSIFIGPLYRLGVEYEKAQEARFGRGYPLGLPDADGTGLFLLKDVISGAVQTLNGLKDPTLVYLHFFPPHEPSSPTQQFREKFTKAWKPPTKPIHTLSKEKNSERKMVRARQSYDEYLASWDAEVARLIDFMEASGLLDHSYVIITSDHGQMFERGEIGHWTPLMFDPVMHIPLIISVPGQKGRQDIYTATSNVDLLPTVAHITGNPAPIWADGKLLPGLGGIEDVERSIYVMDAKTNSSFTPLTKISISLTKNHYRLSYYKYPNYEQFEFYDLEDDPDELKDLYPSRPLSALKMQDELLQKLDEVNRLHQNR